MQMMPPGLSARCIYVKKGWRQKMPFSVFIPFSYDQLLSHDQLLQVWTSLKSQQSAASVIGYIARETIADQANPD